MKDQPGGKNLHKQNTGMATKEPWTWAAPFLLLPAGIFFPWMALGSGQEMGLTSLGLGVLTGLSAVPQQQPASHSCHGCCDPETPLTRVSRSTCVKVQGQDFSKVLPFMAHKGLPRCQEAPGGRRELSPRSCRAHQRIALFKTCLKSKPGHTTVC